MMAQPGQSNDSEVAPLRALLEEIFSDFWSVPLETVTEAERAAIEFVLAREGQRES